MRDGLTALINGRLTPSPLAPTRGWALPSKSTKRRPSGETNINPIGVEAIELGASVPSPLGTEFKARLESAGSPVTLRIFESPWKAKSVEIGPVWVWLIGRPPKQVTSSPFDGVSAWLALVICNG